MAAFMSLASRVLGGAAAITFCMIEVVSNYRWPFSSCNCALFIKGGRGRGLAELILTLPTLSHAYLFVELLINSKLEVIEG